MMQYKPAPWPGDTFPLVEADHGVMVSNTNQQMSMGGTGTMTFVGSSCGDVTPDKPQIIK